MKPTTHYTKSGSINIAYQVFGTGTNDLVYIPGWVSNIDLMWACPELVNFLLALGKMCRVILFDKRGTGLSDRIVESSTLEERMDDIRAVMDAVGSEKAVLFGHSEGGSVSALFAATYPHRTISLITFGIFAKRRYSPEYPWAPTDEERQVVYDMIENDWGGGNMNLASLAPSRKDDKIFIDWLANYFRSGASPSAAMVLTKMNTEVDIINILSSIKVPTLIMQRKHDIDVKIEEGRFIAERIQGSRFVTLEGSDHLFWVGDSEEILDEIRSFLDEVQPQQTYNERLYTVLAGSFSAEYLTHDVGKLILDLIEKGSGSHVQIREDGRFISTFDGPGKAVHCGIGLITFLRSLTIEAAAVVDMQLGTSSGELLLKPASHREIESLIKETKYGHVYATQAVRYLLSRADIQFAADHPVSAGQDATMLYRVSDPYEEEYSTRDTALRGNAFLDDILDILEKNYQNEAFGVEFLCKEVGISERQLQRKLKAITNKSPGQLIASVRLHKAKELLSENAYNISEVAYMTGFNNPSYFTRCFRKEFGLSPSAVASRS